MTFRATCYDIQTSANALGLCQSMSPFEVILDSNSLVQTSLVTTVLCWTPYVTCCRVDIIMLHVCVYHTNLVNTIETKTLMCIIKNLLDMLSMMRVKTLLTFRGQRSKVKQMWGTQRFYPLRWPSYWMNFTFSHSKPSFLQWSLILFRLFLTTFYILYWPETFVFNFKNM